MSSCGCGNGQGGSAARPDREVNIDFLYLDNEVCERCGDTGERLKQAVALVSPVLEALGVALNLRHVHVRTVEEAKAQRFVSSPTIRVNGRDIAGEVEESECGSCSELAGQTPVDCRQWTWRGESDSAAPVGLIVEAILRAALGGTGAAAQGAEDGYVLPDNLERFFRARRNESKRTCC